MLCACAKFGGCRPGWASSGHEDVPSRCAAPDSLPIKRTISAKNETRSTSYDYDADVGIWVANSTWQENAHLKESAVRTNIFKSVGAECALFSSKEKAGTWQKDMSKLSVQTRSISEGVYLGYVAFP